MTETNTNGDTPVHVAMMNLLWPRDGLPVQDFWDYWVGAHTQISSRLPAIHQYFQHQLDPDGGRLFPSLGDTVTHEYESDELFHGDAEITFLTPDDLARFAAALNPLMQDERNVFSKTISYQAKDRNTRTFKDATQDDSPNGDLGGEQKFMLYLRKRDDVELDEFRRTLIDDIGSALAALDTVLKVRIRLLEFYDNDAVTLLAPNVSNWEDPAKQYQGCIEIVFSGALARQEFALSTGWSAIAVRLAAVVRTVHRQQALRTFTVYNHGKVTLAGLRTPQMADQIKRLGAINQKGSEVISLILREHTNYQ